MTPNRPAPGKCPGYPLPRPATGPGSKPCAKKVPEDEYWCIKCRKRRAAEIEREQNPPGGIGPTVDNLRTFPAMPITPDRWWSTGLPIVDEAEEKPLDQEAAV